MNKDENTLVRFSLRSLLALMALASIILAITVPYIRSQPAEMQKFLGWSIGIAGAVGVVVFLGLCLYRVSIERMSGALLFHPRQSFAMRWGLACLMVPLFTGILFLTGKIVADLLLTSSELSGQFDFAIFANVSSVLFLLIPISALIFTTVLPFWGLGILSLEVREKGFILSGCKFHPWASGVKLECLPAKRPHRTVVTILLKNKKSTTVIHSDDREELEQHLLELGIPPK